MKSKQFLFSLVMMLVLLLAACAPQAATVQQEGGLATFAQVGCRVEIPGCSLCMGNQARVKPGATVISTSTRNFDNRLGDGAKVYLGSTELTAISGLLGRLPSVAEYMAFVERKMA